MHRREVVLHELLGILHGGAHLRDVHLLFGLSPVDRICEPGRRQRLALRTLAFDLVRSLPLRVEGHVVQIVVAILLDCILLESALRGLQIHVIVMLFCCILIDEIEHASLVRRQLCQVLALDELLEVLTLGTGDVLILAWSYASAESLVEGTGDHLLVPLAVEHEFLLLHLR